MSIIDEAALDEIARSATRSCGSCAGLDLASAARRLAEDGLTVLLAPDPFGAALDPVFALPVMAASGHARLAFPLAETIAASRLSPWLPESLIGAALEGSLVLTATRDSTLTGQRDGGGALVSGAIGGLPCPEADFILAPAMIDGAQALVLLQRSDPTGATQHIADLEVERPRATLFVSGATTTALVSDADAIREFTETLDLLHAADMQGAAQAAFDAALAHLAVREQFGKILATFQSLRHDLARARMTLESGERLLRHAATCLDGDERSRAISMAIAHASDACPRIAETALHMHGGMGFTWDVPAHLWLRRIRATMGSRDAKVRRADLAARLLPAIA